MIRKHARYDVASRSRYSNARLPLSAYEFMLDAAQLLSLAETKEQQDLLLGITQRVVQEGREISYVLREIRAAISRNDVQ